MLHDSQTVHDIIEEVINAHYDFADDYDKIASFFDGYSVKQVADELYKFCKNNIKYIEETEHEQTVSSPGAILHRGHCDCKGYSNFIGGVLGALNRMGAGINWNYRFASYDVFDNTPHHVFVVAQDGNNEIWIDPTPGSEKKEPTWYTDKKIKEKSLNKVGSLYKVSGLPVTINDSISGTSTGSGTSLLSSIFSTVASGGNPTEAIIKFAGSPEAGQLIKGITTNIKSLVEGIEDIFHRDMKTALEKVYQMFPINTQYPSYVQMDAQVNAIKAYTANMCDMFTKCQSGVDPGACEWLGAYQAVVASYGTLSTWLKVQEAIQSYIKDNPVSSITGMDINPLLIGAGAFFYLTGDKTNTTIKVTGTKNKNNLLLMFGLGAGLYLWSKKSPAPIKSVTNTFVTDIATLPTETQLIEMSKQFYLPDLHLQVV